MPGVKRLPGNCEHTTVIWSCVFCRRRYGRENYKNNPERYKRKAHDRRQSYLTKIEELKSVPCMDCGQTFDPFCMDFDHVRGEKFANISELARDQVSWQRILDEIEKCDIICSNCHRLRTKARYPKNLIEF
jgi:hypothetical protein